jgi:predicted nucleic acid-binding protein
MAQRQSCISVSPYQTNCSLLSRSCERSRLSLQNFKNPRIAVSFRRRVTAVAFSAANLCPALKKFAHIGEAVSFTDCIVMAVADEYGTPDIFGFDKQFQEAGYHRLEPATN